MRNGVAATLVVAVVIVSAAAGYYAGISGSQPKVATIAQCGFVRFCSVESASGLVLTASINGSATIVKPNGSLVFEVDEFNPTTHYIDLSPSDHWFVSSMPYIWQSCSPHHDFPTSGIEIFRGYYTLQNVTSAKNILSIPVPRCPAGMHPIATGFSVSPSSDRVQVQWNNGQNDSMTDGISGYVFANEGLIACGADLKSWCAVASLGSSQPAVYTIAAGDEWGALLLSHFWVVTCAQFTAVLGLSSC